MNQTPPRQAVSLLAALNKRGRFFEKPFPAALRHTGTAFSWENGPAALRQNQRILYWWFSGWFRPYAQ